MVSRAGWFLAVLVLPGLAVADLYRCQRPDGSTAFQDLPCERREKQMERHSAPRSASPEAAARTADADMGPPATTNMLQRARIAEGLSIATQLKVQVTQFYMEEGRLPSSNKMLGLPPPGEYVRNAVIGMEVRKDGEIVVRYNGQSGVEGGQLRLKPDISKPHMGLGWDCTSPSYMDIASWAATCRYTGAEE